MPDQEQTGTPEGGKRSKKRVNSLGDIRRRSTRRRWIVIAAVLVLAAAGGFFVITSRQRAASESAQQAAAVSASVTVQARTFREEVEVSGNVVPLKSENLFFRTTGEMQEVAVAEGDRVAAGDMVAKIRLRTKELELTQLEYELEQARFEGSVKQVELLELRKELLLEDIDNAYLKAGISGVVSRVNIEPGDLVGSSVSDPAVRIIDHSSLKASVEVDEFDINALRVGQRAELVFDALGSSTVVKGRVSSIPLEGSVTSQGIAVKRVEIVIDDPPQGVSPSYTFSGVIIAGEQQQVLTFPQEFLVRTDTSHRVFKQTAGGEAVPVEVRTVYFESGLVRVISGDIREGDVLIRQRAAPTGMSSPFAFAPGGRR